MGDRFVQPYVFSLALLLGIPLGVSAAPSISSVSGGATHGSQLTISGSGFGSKGTAAPQVWDACAQAGLSSQWTGAWPNASSDANNNLKCRAPIRGVALPHNNITMYMAGSHAESNGANAGYNVMAFKSRAISSYPAYSYSSWYERMDPAWAFGRSNGDNNHKIWDFSNGGEPYDLPNNWYFEHNTRFSSASGTDGAYHVVDDAGLMTSNYSQMWGAGGVPNPWQNWVKMEVIVKITKDGSGWVKGFANNKQLYNVSGLVTDPYGGSTKAISIGGYDRNYGSSSNWRYYADMYMDTSLARVVLANSATYSSATVVETQPAASWASGQVAVKVNMGKLSASSGVYAFVFDDTGTANSTGFKLGSAGTPAAVVPNPPSSVSVQ